jgi:hypothetical protein
MALSLQALALAIWFGGGLSVLYATRAIFALAPTRREAGQYSGAVLRSFRWLQAAAGLLFAAAAYQELPRPTRIAGQLALLLMVSSLLLDAPLRRLRAQMGGSTEGLDADDPLRKRFGALHGISVLLLIGQVLCAGAGLIVLRR